MKSWLVGFRRLITLSFILGSIAFSAWYLTYVYVVGRQISSVCSSITPYLQMGSYRWAEDLASGSLSASYPELSVRVVAGAYSPSVSKGERPFVIKSCEVPGRNDDTFTIILVKGHGFSFWLAKRLAFFVLALGLLFAVASYLFRIIFEQFMNQLTEVINSHFGISNTLLEDTFVSKVLRNFIARLPELQAPKRAIENLSSQLQRELTHSSELELALNQRRLFSKYIHDIRSPLSALKIVFQKRSASFSEEELGILNQTFIRFDELSSSVLTHEKKALQQTLSFRELLKFEDLKAILEIVIDRLRLAFKDQCEVGLAYGEGLDTAGHLHISAIELDRLITNLVHNSKDANSSVVRIFIACVERTLALEISDNGQGGLGADLRPKRSKVELRSVTGYGLGLEIVNEILAKGQATYSVSSPIGKGTRIAIHFPLSAMSN